MTTELDCGLSQPRSRTDLELTNEMLTLLKIHWMSSYTHRQIANILDAVPDQTQQVLESIVQAGVGVIRWKSTWIMKNTGRKQPMWLFKWSPWRLEIDQDITRTYEVIERLVTHLLKRRPGQCKRAIRQAMRDAFGHIDDHIIDFVLTGMTEAGIVVIKQGPRRANLHYLKSSVVPRGIEHDHHTGFPGH